jgi:TonB family protein
MPHKLKLLPVVCALTALACALSLAPAAARAQGPAADFERGKQMLAQGDANGAAEVLGRVAESRKTDADVWYEFGLALTRANRQKQARKAFERAVALRDSAPARTGLAFTQLLLGKTRDAEHEAERALKLDPGYVQAHYVVAAVNFRKNGMEAAAREAEEALRLDPNFVSAALLWGEALLNIFGGEYESASERYPVRPDMRAELLSAAFERREESVASAKERLRVAAERLRRLADPLAGGSRKEDLNELASTLEFYGAPKRKGDPPGAFRQSDVSTKAVILAKPTPGYTEDARRNLTTGTVRLRAVLGADGRVRHIMVVEGLPNGLTERSIEAARQIRFTPATLDGRRVSQYVTLEYNFNVELRYGGMPPPRVTLPPNPRVLPLPPPNRPWHPFANE